MRSYYNNPLYLEDVNKVLMQNYDFEKLSNSSILISGARGQIGSFFIDTLMFLNKEKDFGCKIFALGRNKNAIEDAFTEYLKDDNFKVIECDINGSDLTMLPEKVDYIIHCASNTHPVAYATEPINTILTNVVGTNNLLKYATNCNLKRFVFISSNEVYGENRGDTELFDEKYCGYIDCNTLRAGYPESKRCGEALCQAYISQNKLDIVIARVTRTYGPNLLSSDSKALSQFLKNGLNNENIVLKSEGNQFYSYMYIADTVSGIYATLLNGENGQCYNISDKKSDITLKNLASLIANYSNTKVVFELPDEVEAKGFSKATKALLDNSKIKEIGFKPIYDINEGINRTLNMLKHDKEWMK